MRDPGDEDGPDPDYGIWGWEQNDAPVPELTPFEKMQIRLRDDAEERRKERWRRQREMEDRQKSDFNRYLIDLYNEAMRK